MPIFSFKKNERLCSKKDIEEVFHNGKSFLVHPFKVNWLRVESNQKYPAKTAFSVSKKRIKKACKRNLLKRRMKEAFRQNKLELYAQLEETNININLFIVFIDNDVPDFEFINRKIIVTLQRLIKEINHEHGN